MRKVVRTRYGRLMRALLFLFAILAALLPSRAAAADVRGGTTVTVGPTDIVNDDLYASGNEINIRGTVNGDVVAFGGTINIPGTVTGDVIAAGGTIDIGGTVRGSVRAAGGNVNIRGRVVRDAVVAGGSVNLTPQASIGRDLLLAASTAVVNAPVARNIRANAGDLTLGSPVGGDVEANVGSLRLTSGAAINGNLIYTSPQDATLDPGATVRGRIEHRAPPEEPPVSPVSRVGLAILAWLQTFVGLFVLGLLVVLPFPRFTSRAIGLLRASPWASLGLGFALLVGVPALAFIVFILGLLVGGWWLALMLLALYGIAIAVSYVISAVFLGCAILERVGRAGAGLVWALLLGLVLLLLVGLVPIVGGIVGFVAVLFGLGALSLTLFRVHQEQEVAPISR